MFRREIVFSRKQLKCLADLIGNLTLALHPRAKVASVQVATSRLTNPGFNSFFLLRSCLTEPLEKNGLNC